MDNAVQIEGDGVACGHADAERSLWKRWAAGRDMRTRELLVEYYSGWTRSMAKRVFMRVRIPGVEWTDFMQLATIGLLESIDRFEPERGLHFTTYARHRVRGSILNGLRLYRDHGNHGSYESGERLSDRATSLASAESGEDLLAEIIEISVGLAMGHLLDIRSLSGHGDGTEGYTTVENDLMLEELARLVGGLPERESKVIRYHYYQHLPFVEVATLLGITKGRVSQLHKQAVMRLRKQLETAENWDLRA